MYPHWYMTFIELIARNPKHLTSIVASDQDLTVNYNFVELCYQDIIFNLNDTNMFIGTGRYNLGKHVIFMMQIIINFINEKPIL